MSISGHKSEATFEHYIKMKKSEHADRIAEKLNSTPNSLFLFLLFLLFIVNRFYELKERDMQACEHFNTFVLSVHWILG